MERPRPDGCPRITRRAALGGLAAGLASVVACEGRRTPPAARVPLEALGGGRRVVVQVGPAAVEVRQDGDRVAARYLVCSHMGCRVSPDAVSGGYRCACHEGRYDADGRPAGGPPTGPLPDAPFAIEDGAVVFRLG